MKTKTARYWELYHAFFFRLEARLGGWEFTSETTKTANGARAERLARAAMRLGASIK